MFPKGQCGQTSALGIIDPFFMRTADNVVGEGWTLIITIRSATSNATGRVVERESPGEAENSSLRCHMKPQLRAGSHDPAQLPHLPSRPTPFSHFRHTERREKKYAGQVYAEAAIPDFNIGLQHGTLRVNGRRVHEYIQTAEQMRRFKHRRFDVYSGRASQ